MVGERIASYDVEKNVFITIAKDVRFNVSYEQTHVLS
jgi:hypothetical protein